MSWQPSLNARYLVPMATAFQAAGLGKTVGYERQKAGLFVKPVKPCRKSFIPSDELTALIDAHVAGLPEERLKALVSDLHAKRAATYTVS